MIVTLNGRSYEMDRKKFEKTVKNIKKMLPKKVLMIISVEKEGHAEMRKDKYKTQAELTQAINDWNKKGFLVKYTRGI